MCIAFISTSHPDYAYVVLGNRDEYLARPTAHLARWPPPHDFVLAGRDLKHPAQGTWMGITQHGRLAILTNFREEDQPAPGKNDPSRGEIAKSFLTSEPRQAEREGLEGFAQRLLELEGSKWKRLGGFTLIFADVRPSRRSERSIGIVSNRTPDVDGVIWIGDQATAGMTAGGKTVGATCALSNSRFGDNAWPKVVDGRRLLDELISESVGKGEGQDEFLERIFALLSRATLRERLPDEDWEIYLRQLRNSIFVPPIGEDGLGRPLYGTQKQTVILVRHDGRTVMVERTLFDDDVRPEKRDTPFEWHLEDP